MTVATPRKRNQRSARRAGSSFNNAVVDYLAKMLPAFRERAHGKNDIGDVGGVDGFVLECKNGVLNLGPWMDEAQKEAFTAHVYRYAVVHKRHGRSDIKDAHVTMPLWMFREMLAENHAQRAGDIVSTDQRNDHERGTE